MSTRPLHVLTFASAMIGVGSLLVVGRSFFRAAHLQVRLGQGAFSVTAVDGQLLLSDRRAPILLTSQPLLFRVDDAVPVRRMLNARWRELTGVPRVGFGFDFTTNPFAKDLVLPLWLLPALAALLPWRWWRGRHRYSGKQGFDVSGVGTSKPEVKPG